MAPTILTASFSFLLTLSTIMSLSSRSQSLANPLPAPQDVKLEDITGKVADSSIGSSTDVWAMLVANIVPLLILLGEKHVKAYFKTMRHFTHYMMYAVGPIGLVTAVVTLIRILPDNFRSLKRLIGRQYERRAEVLSDVTSVSCGAVETELKNGAFEQTTEPGDRSDVAICYIQGKAEGSVEATFNAIRDYWDDAGYIYEQFISTVTTQVLPSLPGQFILSYSFRSKEVRTARQLALYAFQAPHSHFYFDKLHKLHPESVEALKNTEAYGIVSTFSAITGVSMGLTTVANKDTSWRMWFRVILSTIVIAADIVLIQQNWKIQRDLQNTILISIGLFISTTGAFYTGYIVDSLSSEKSFSIRNIVKSGFYSEISKDWGRQLKENPKEFVISSDAEATAKSKARIKEIEKRSGGTLDGEIITIPYHQNLQLLVEGWKKPPKDYTASWIDYLTVTVALLMTVGYVALYVGLRTAEFWIALSIFASSMVASLARAFLAPDKLELENEELSHARLTPAFPFSYRAEKNTDIGELETFFWDLKESTFEEAADVQYPKDQSTPTDWKNSKSEELNEPTRSATAVYEVLGAIKGSPIAFDSSLADFTSSLTQFKRNEHLYSALRLTIALRKRFLVPAELIYFTKASEVSKFLRYPSRGGMGLPCGLLCPAFSDILNPHRVHRRDQLHLMRQPLEVLIHSCKQEQQHWGFAGAIRNAAEDSTEDLNVDAWGVTMWDFIINFQTWFWRAEAAYTNRKKRIYLRTISNMVEDDFNIMGLFVRDRKKPAGGFGLSPNDCSWMAIKIAYLTFRGWPIDKLESFYNQIPVPNGANLLVGVAGEEHVETVLQLAEKTKTYIDVKKVLKQTNGSSVTFDQLMDEAISPRRWLSCKSPQELEQVVSPFEEIKLDLTEVMFE